MTECVRREKNSRRFIFLDFDEIRTCILVQMGV